MRFVIVTGMSGGGKSTAMKMLEDAGFYCADNIPVALIDKFVELITMPNSTIQNVALGLDVRAAQSFDDVNQAVEDLAADGHDALKLRVARELDGAKGGIALDDIDLALRHILRAAVDELLHAVGDVKAAGQLLFDVQAGLFGRFAAPLVDEDLIGDAVSLLLVFDEVDVQPLAEELCHGVLHKFIGDGLFRLVSLYLFKSTWSEASRKSNSKEYLDFLSLATA